MPVASHLSSFVGDAQILTVATLATGIPSDFHNFLFDNDEHVRSVTVFSSLSQIIREVKVLAALDHPNVVGYNAAWMEHWIRPGRILLLNLRN